MYEPTIIIAECGCRFKAVSALPVLTQAVLELEVICVAHSQERTKKLLAEEPENENPE